MTEGRERIRPTPRLIRSPADAETAAADWMRFFGFADANPTPPGADGGVDVRSTAAVAQVKAHMTPVGRPDLQRLHGVAVSEGRKGLFFSLMYYSPQALAWADEVGMALFRFDYSGEPEPMNDAAAAIAGLPVVTAGRSPALTQPQPGVPAPPASDVQFGQGTIDEQSIGTAGWQPTDRVGQFVRYARRLKRNGHPVSGYCLQYASTEDEKAAVERWADLGVH